MVTKIESLWNTYGAINELIRFADTKATALLAINGVIVGFFFSNISDVQFLLEQNTLAALLLTISIAFVIISASCSAYCIMPRLACRKNCLLFFNDIAKYENVIDYETAWQTASRTKIESEIINQIWENSKIATKKYDYVSCSVFFFVAALFASISFSLVILYG